MHLVTMGGIHRVSLTTDWAIVKSSFLRRDAFDDCLIFEPSHIARAVVIAASSTFPKGFDHLAHLKSFSFVEDENRRGIGAGSLLLWLRRQDMFTCRCQYQMYSEGSYLS
jgi:hypothetical protein